MSARLLLAHPVVLTPQCPGEEQLCEEETLLEDVQVALGLAISEHKQLKCTAFLELALARHPDDDTQYLLAFNRGFDPLIFLCCWLSTKATYCIVRPISNVVVNLLVLSVVGRPRSAAVVSCSMMCFFNYTTP